MTESELKERKEKLNENILDKRKGGIVMCYKLCYLPLYSEYANSFIFLNSWFCVKTQNKTKISPPKSYTPIKMLKKKKRKEIKKETKSKKKIKKKNIRCLQQLKAHGKC